MVGKRLVGRHRERRKVEKDASGLIGGVVIVPAISGRRWGVTENRRFGGAERGPVELKNDCATRAKGLMMRLR